MDEKERTEDLPKTVVLLGPTASGKTKWGLLLAKEFNGEVISADSRQMYKKMDIGTAKDPGEWKWSGLLKAYMVEEVPHHLVDFLNPGNAFTAAEFRDKSLSLIRSIIRRGRTPFVVGGTGLYIKTLVDNLKIPRVPPNMKLRRSLEGKSLDELARLLATMDPETAAVIDIKNKRRLVRALEVCIMSGAPFSKQQQKGKPVVNALQIGIDVPRDELYGRINTRIDGMMEKGLLNEVKELVRQKYAWDLPSMSGIGYRQFREYLDGTLTLRETVERLKRDTRHFARRQLTWFRRDPRIHWCRTYDDARSLIRQFLS